MPTSATINSDLVSRGPAVCTYTHGDTVLQLLSEGDVSIDSGIATADQVASFAGGPIETFRTAVNPTVSLKPLGLTTYLALLQSFASAVPGRSLKRSLQTPTGGGAAAMADHTLLVQPLDVDQPQTLYHGVAISKVTDVVFSAAAPLFDGTLDFRVLGTNNVAPTAADRLFTQSANLFAALDYDPATLVRQAYDVTYSLLGAGAAFGTAKGAKLSLGLNVTEHTADSVHIYDVSFGHVQPVVTLTPVGISEADLLTALRLQGAGSQVGGKLSASGDTLLIAGTGVYCRVPLAGIRKAPLTFGAAADRIGDLEFFGSVSVGAGGVLAPRFYLGTQPPP